tara:strand:- start:569 stop:2710 length:2142 start_codon:yes stop_codon:yes gene_type:complete
MSENSESDSSRNSDGLEDENVGSSEEDSCSDEGDSRLDVLDEAKPPSLMLIDEIKSKLAHRKQAMNIEEEFFTNRNSEVRDSCTRTINMNMSLSSNAAFAGTYPKVRELLQNAIDYLGLCKHGLRKSEVNINVESTDNSNSHSKRITFSAGETTLLVLDVKPDRLVIYQHLTCPLEIAILQNPVVDPAKQSRNAAGGFGVGAKDATRQWITEGASVKYFMYGETECISWEFKAKKPSTRSSIYSSSRGFEVFMKSKRYTDASKRVPQRVNLLENKKWLDKNTLCIEINATRIGMEMDDVYSKIALFWDVSITPRGELIPYTNAFGRQPNSENLIEHDGDFMIYPDILCIYPGLSFKTVANGVYCMGLYVCNEFFSRCVYMSGSHSPCAVKRRDRDTIDSYMMRQAVNKLFSNVLRNNRELLTKLFRRTYLGVLDHEDQSVPNFLRAQDNSFYKRALDSSVLKQAIGVDASNGVFVDKPEEGYIGRKLVWAVNILHQTRKADVLVLNPGAGAGMLERSSVECMLERAMSILEVVYDAPFSKAVRLVLKFFTLPNSIIQVLHTETLKSNIYYLKTRQGGNYVVRFATDTSNISARLLQSVCLKLQHAAEEEEQEEEDENKINRLFEFLYTTLPSLTSNEAILRELDLRVQELQSSTTRQTVVVQGTTVQSTSSTTRQTVVVQGTTVQSTRDVFATFKRALESSGLELVNKVVRLE